MPDHVVLASYVYDAKGRPTIERICAADRLPWPCWVEMERVMADAEARQARAKK